MISFSQNSVESILTRESLTQASALTSTQSQVDVLVSRFSEEATNWRSLAAMATGSLFYRFGRMGTLALASRASGLAPVLQAASYGVGLGTEVTAFEGTSRLLASVSGERTNPHLWDWNGRGGWREGLASSLVTFGMLKGAGSLAQGQNVVLQHLFSDLAMVGGQQVASGLGFMERPEGSIGEQLLHAEVTNLQLGLGMGLLHRFSPGLVSWERSLDLSLRARENLGTTSVSSGTQIGPREALAYAEGMEIPSAEAETSLSLPLVLHMSGEGKGDPGKNDTVRMPALNPDATRRPSSSEQFFRQGFPYRIEGVPSGVRLIQVSSFTDPMPLIVETIENFLKERVRSFVVQLDERTLDAHARGALRIDMYRIFRELEVDEGVVVALAMPKSAEALLFFRQKPFIRMQTVRLLPGSGASQTGMQGTSTLPGLASTSATAGDPAADKGMRASPRSPTSSMPPPPADHRFDTMICSSVPEVLEAFRRLTRPTDGKFIVAPVIRLQTGRMGAEDVSSLARVLSDPVLPDGFKITIHWAEKGGGRMIAHRRGDRIGVTFKDFPNPDQHFWILPKNGDLTRREMESYPAIQVKSYALQDLKTYEERAQEELIDLAQQVSPSLFSEFSKDRERDPLGGVALRAQQLGRLTREVLKGGASRSGSVDLSLERTRIGQIHRMLERAYTFFEFELLERFQENTGHSVMARYGATLDGLNQRAAAEKTSFLVPFFDMDLHLPGRRVLPSWDYLKYDFLTHLLPTMPGESPPERSPRENLSFLQDPARMGKVYSSWLRDYLRRLIAAGDELERKVPNVRREELYSRTPLILPDEIQKFREEVLAQWALFPEYTRVFFDRDRRFTRLFLAAAFNDAKDLRTAYLRVHSIWSRLPSQVSLGAVLLSLDQIDGIIAGRPLRR
ncbi:MAG: hypothetical protein U1F57_00700 [bacterium]